LVIFVCFVVGHLRVPSWLVIFVCFVVGHLRGFVVGHLRAASWLVIFVRLRGWSSSWLRGWSSSWLVIFVGASWLVTFVSSWLVVFGLRGCDRVKTGLEMQQILEAADTSVPRCRVRLLFAQSLSKSKRPFRGLHAASVATCFNNLFVGISLDRPVVEPA
jgi:hypothetical protein